MKKSKFTRPLTIALSPELFEKVKEDADRKDISYAECIREILADYFESINSKKQEINHEENCE